MEEVETDKFMSSAAGKLTYIYKYGLRLGSAWQDWTVPLSLCDMMVTHQSDGLWTHEKVESWCKISSVEIQRCLFSLFVSYV